MLIIDEIGIRKSIEQCFRVSSGPWRFLGIAVLLAAKRQGSVGTAQQSSSGRGARPRMSGSQQLGHDGARSPQSAAERHGFIVGAKAWALNPMLFQLAHAAIKARKRTTLIKRIVHTPASSLVSSRLLLLFRSREGGIGHVGEAGRDRRRSWRDRVGTTGPVEKYGSERRTLRGAAAKAVSRGFVRGVFSGASRDTGRDR
jgi:hypothetical protein